MSLRCYELRRFEEKNHFGKVMPKIDKQILLLAVSLLQICKSVTYSLESYPRDPLFVYDFKSSSHCQ